MTKKIFHFSFVLLFMAIMGEPFLHNFVSLMHGWDEFGVDNG
jgi:hypothetical protein